MKPSSVCFLLALNACAAPDVAEQDAGEDQDGGAGGSQASGGVEQPSDTAGRSGEVQSGGTGGVGGTQGEGGNGAPGGNAGSSGMPGGAAGSIASGGAAGSPAIVNAALYAWDDFSSPPGDIVSPNTNFFNIGMASGKGWGRGWDQGEHSSNGYFAFANVKPLTFATLATSGNYLLRRRWDLGRTLDLKQATLAPLVQNNQVAKAGTVVWLSVLVRLDGGAATQNNDLALVTLHHHPFGYHYYGSDTAWVAGVWPSRGVNNWSLWVGSGTSEPLPGGQNDPKQSARMSTKAVVVGVPNLVVVKVEISGGPSDRISLYIDPPSLGGAAPQVPDAVAMTGQSARFRTFAVGSSTGDNNPFPVSFDEVRIGPTFASVTPTR